MRETLDAADTAVDANTKEHEEEAAKLRSSRLELLAELGKAWLSSFGCQRSQCSEAYFR